MELKTALKKYFGYETFRSAQEEIIRAILAKKSVVAILPTGAGKSLCYQLPALISDNFSIVISPLIALMKDQVDNLNKETEIAAFINSTMDFSETEEVLKKIAFGKIKLLYVAPERLENKNFAERIVKLNPSYLFVDEAHCISEWGHNFRPSYTKIKEFIDYCSIKKVAAFTATATPEVVEDIIIQLKLKDPEIFVRGFERKNLHLNVETDVNKPSKTFELLYNIKGPAIVYTSSRKKAEEISEYLLLKGITCAYYHAGVSSNERRKIQDDFISGKLRVIAATNAFGMGIDKKNIRLIIHYNTPGSIENYYQEIGRAGRDGKDSYIYLLHDDNDINIQNYFISVSHPTKEQIQKFYDAICDFNQVAVGSLPENELIVDTEYITNYTGEKVSKGLLHASLKFLENAGYVKKISEFDKKDTLQIISDKSKLKTFIKRTSNEELKNILLVLIREFESDVFQKQVKISISYLSSLAALSEDTLHNQLITLDNLGLISYKPSIEKETILLTAPRVKSNDLVLNYKKLNESSINARRKLDKMIDFVYTKECRFKYILNYFGENTENYACGKCDNCKVEEKISDSTAEYLSELLLNTIAEAANPLPELSIIKILKGEREKESFSKFSTFGTGANYSSSEINVVLQNLISRKLVLRLPGKSRLVELSVKGSEKTEKLFPFDEAQKEPDEDLSLFHKLRQIRKKTSEKFMQTAYLLCPDEILREVVRRKPKTKSELLSINGFNLRMFNKIGNDFLEAINEPGHNSVKNSVVDEKQIPQNIKATYDLLIKKYSLGEIASLRKLSEAVISMQIESIIEYKPATDISHLFEGETYNLIETEIEKGYDSLKKLKENLPSNITYAQLRIAVAKNKFSHSL